MIGLGIITYNRPEYFEQCITGVIQNLLDEVDILLVYNDGSSGEYQTKYDEIYQSIPRSIVIINAGENKGVAYSKNYLLKRMMDAGCDYLFLLEDDTVPVSSQAIKGYLEASRKSGYEHLSFSYHDGLEHIHPFLTTKYVSFSYLCIGAYSFYTRNVINTVGYMDENFNNAFEHVEHTVRIINAKLTAPYGSFVDASGSDKWLKPIAGSLDNSIIRKDTDWQNNMNIALEYWKKKDGRGKPIHPPRIIRIAQIFLRSPKLWGIIPRFLLP